MNLLIKFVPDELRNKFSLVLMNSQYKIPDAIQLILAKFFVEHKTDKEIIKALDQVMKNKKYSAPLTLLIRKTILDRHSYSIPPSNPNKITIIPKDKGFKKLFKKKKLEEELQ